LSSPRLRWRARLEEAFGTPDLMMLTRQSEPFDVLERWVKPDQNTLDLSQGLDNQPSPFIDEERILYRGCWFSSIGRTLRSDDTRVVNVNATLVYTQRIKITGVAGSAATFNLPL